MRSPMAELKSLRESEYQAFRRVASKAAMPHLATNQGAILEPVIAAMLWLLLIAGNIRLVSLVSVSRRATSYLRSTHHRFRTLPCCQFLEKGLSISDANITASTRSIDVLRMSTVLVNYYNLSRARHQWTCSEVILMLSISDVLHRRSCHSRCFLYRRRFRPWRGRLVHHQCMWDKAFQREQGTNGFRWSRVFVESLVTLRLNVTIHMPTANRRASGNPTTL